MSDDTTAVECRLCNTPFDVAKSEPAPDCALCRLGPHCDDCVVKICVVCKEDVR